MEGLPNRRSDRISGRKYIIDDRVVIWDGKLLKCEHNKRQSRCYECKGEEPPKRTRPDYNFAFSHPELLAFWHKNKNISEPHEFTPKSSKKVWWICELDNSHFFERSIGSRVDGRGLCRSCSFKETSKKKIQSKIMKQGSLTDNHPQIAKEWHPKKNLGVYPSEVLSKSNNKYWWLCHECEHEWKLAVCDRHGYSCPACSGKVVHSSGRNSLASVNPWIIKEWHPTKNGELTPFDILPSSNKIIFWICPECGHNWYSAPNWRFDKKGDSNRVGPCPCCTGKAVHSETAFNSLGVLVPWILDEWDYDNNLVSPKEILPRSHQNINWICKVCDDHWSAKPADRVNKNYSKGTGCPTCSGQKLHRNGNNSLFSLSPEIAKELHPEKNGGISAKEILNGSHDKMWWLCAECEYEWCVPVGNRTGISGTGCAACSNLKIKPDKSNSLALIAPWSIEEWSEKNTGLTPWDIAYSSHKKIWWCCPNCEHEYKAQVNTKVREDGTKFKSCSACVNRVVKPDKSNSLAYLRPDLISEWHSDNPDEPHEITLGSNKMRKWKCRQGHVWNAQVAKRKFHGCNTCAISGFKFYYPASVYVLKIITEHDSFYKSGITNRDANVRMNEILRSAKNAYGSCEVELYYEIRINLGIFAKNIEDYLESNAPRYIPSLIFDGSTECYISDTTEFINMAISEFEYSDFLI